MSRFAKAIAELNTRHSLSESCRAFLDRLANDERTRDISPDIPTLVTVWNIADLWQFQECAADERARAKHKTLKAFASDISNGELADVLEQIAKELSHRDVHVVVYLDAFKEMAELLEVEIQPAPGNPSNVLMSIHLPWTREGNQRRRVFMWWLSALRRWTD
jgi:hypothetical protein